MAHVVCDQISPGLRSSERIVAIKDVHGRTSYLRVEHGFLTQEAGKAWLPVGKIHEDLVRGLTLIEFPQEAESGANRIWVRSRDLLEYYRASA